MEKKEAKIKLVKISSYTKKNRNLRRKRIPKVARKRKVRVGYWNIRSLKSMDKQENVA